MPYRLQEDPGVTRLVAWPHRSLSHKGFAAFILITYAMLLVPLIPLLGTAIFWVLLPFMMGALALVWIFLRKSYADGALTEEMTLDHDRIALVRRDPKGSEKRWEANPYWVTVHLHPTGGPVENYLTLKGAGREVELGAFLSPDERVELHALLGGLLRDPGRVAP